MTLLGGERTDNRECCRKSKGKSGSPSFVPLVARWSAFALPRARSDWVVLPFLAAAYEKHDEAEDEHDGSPGEVEVDAHGFFVDFGGVAGEEAVEAHEAADEEEDEA